MSSKKDVEDSLFIQDEMKTVIKDSIDETIGSQQFQHDKVEHWTNGVGESCIKRLAILNKPFKYVVTTVIMQKNGAGMLVATSGFWNKGTDGSNTIRWENKTMYVIVTIFGTLL
ncbi:uncharacterized protein [Physcomitrium patens]|uniref:Uncharacterized protein n=1 Tax=Physcomitrium patens TaxID=3218 RepID=A0A2K1IH04_PHYPA|nr:dynein light chain Tctex-type-like [Physcomitrium patens]PNR28555.1 hypothetical protein PHYPA_029147 [Physcomitrium patens]|eukprot:XP_024363723.1 dynein light chain Tctex-type-like [Physcomitrella patens]